MKTRSTEEEILDDASTPAAEIHASLDFMRSINRFFGGVSAVTDFFDRADPPAEFTVLDLGTGSGDIPLSLAKWARHAGKSVRVTGLDTNPHCLSYAKKHCSAPEIRYLCASAFDIHHLGTFDYVISSMFFHHLNDADIVRLLGLMATSARRGFLVNDLYRGRRAHTAALFAASLSGKKVVIHDAALSVRRGFVEPDFEKYKTLAALPKAEIRRRPWFRITLECHA